MHIRPFLPTDRDAVRAIVLNEWLRYYVNPILGITEDIVREAHQSLSSSTSVKHVNVISHTRLIGLSDMMYDDVIASGSVVETQDYIHLQSLYVRSDHQGKGYGKMLLSTLLSRHQNPKPWTLGVVTYNVKAIEFYTSFGFHKSGLEYYMGKIPVMEMVKR